MFDVDIPGRVQHDDGAAALGGAGARARHRPAAVGRAREPRAGPRRALRRVGALRPPGPLGRRHTRTRRETRHHSS